MAAPRERPFSPSEAGVAYPLLVAALGIALLTLMDGVVKDLAGRYGIWQLTFLRFAVTALIAAAGYAAVGAPVPDRSGLNGNLIRGVFIGLSTLGFFYGLGRLPITDVFAISYLAPVLVALLAIPLLGERPTAKVFAGLALGFAGVMVTISGVASGDFDAVRLVGAGAVLMSAATYAASVVFLRRQAQRDPLMTVVLFQSAVPALLLAPFAATSWSAVPAYDLVLFALVGGLGFAGHVALAFAFARGEASRLVAVEYTSFIWAALIGVIAFAEIPSIATLIGGMVVVVACVTVRR